MLDIVSLHHIHPSVDPDTMVWVPTHSKLFHLGSNWNFLRPHFPKVLGTHWCGPRESFQKMLLFVDWLPLTDFPLVLDNINLVQILSLIVCFVD